MSTSTPVDENENDLDINNSVDETSEEGSSAKSPLLNNPESIHEDTKSFFKTRHILGFMGFLGFANVYAMRVNLSVAIVAMVNHTAIPKIPDNITECPVTAYRNDTYTIRNGDFDWDEATQGIVLGSFFYGYVLTQVPGGRLAELYGGKKIYGFGVLITAIFTFLTPIAAYWSLPALILVRTIEGMGEGVTYPSMHAMLAHWIPPLERSKFAAIVYAGSNIGTVLSLPLAGWLCSLDLLGGWPLAFYIFGFLGLLWFIAWWFIVYDSPQLHPRISPSERLYIEQAVKLKDDPITGTDPDEGVPWASILTSLPVWAILITQCGNGWAFYTQLTELPSYMDNILHANIQQNALLSALPYLTAWIVGIMCSVTADYMLAKNMISQKNSYKLWNSVASIIPSLGLIGVTWANCDKLWVMIMLAGAGAFGGAVYAGNQMNHISLSPRYAGTMYGITNGAANACGFLAPWFIGRIINGNETLAQWRIVFFLAAFVNIIGNFFYLMFASDEEQPWSKRSTRNNQNSF